MKIYDIENKLQIYAKLNSSRKVNIAETRISIEKLLWANEVGLCGNCFIVLRQKLFVQYWRTRRLIAFMLLRVFSLTWSCLLVPTILSFRFLTHVLPKLKYEEKLCDMSCVNDLMSTLGYRKYPRKKSTDHVDTKKCTLWRGKKIMHHVPHTF